MARRGKKRTGAHLWEALGLLGLLTAGACFDSKPPASGNSNWLSPCDTSDDCADGTSCECGVCAITCDATSDCSEAGEGAVCGVAAAWGSQCESQGAADARVCTVTCDSDDVCEGAMGSGFICVGTACLSSDGFMSRPGTGGDAGPTGGMTGGSMEPTGGMTGGSVEPTGGATGGTVDPETGGATGGIADPVSGGALPDTGGVVDPGPGPVDGDGTCESGETPETAPLDCAVTGDGLCTGDENLFTMPNECPRMSIGVPQIYEAPSKVAVSGDGSSVAYILSGNAYVYDLRSGTVTLLTMPAPYGNPAPQEVAISEDGRLVLLQLAGPFVASDSNRTDDVYLFELETGDVMRVAPSVGGGYLHGFGADGDRVFFSHLGLGVPGGLYEFDLATEEYRVVSDPAYRPLSSADGTRRVAVSARAEVPDDVNGVEDIYLFETGKEPVRVSTSVEGYGANDKSLLPSISLDGRLVAFESRATNLVEGSEDNPAGKATNRRDIFVKDLRSGQVMLVTPTALDDHSNIDYTEPVLSGNGRYVVFVAIRSGQPYDANLVYIGDWVDSLPNP